MIYLNTLLIYSTFRKFVILLSLFIHFHAMITMETVPPRKFPMPIITSERNCLLAIGELDIR